MGRPGVFERTPEYCKKLSEGVKKHLPKTAYKKGHLPWHTGNDSRIICIDCGKKTHSWRGKRCLKCYLKFAKGKNHFNWKGGILIDKSGYILKYNSKHPFADNKGYVREHRLIIEKQIGRYLHRWEYVHHINKIKNCNFPENLMAFKSNSAHRRFETKGKIKKEEIIFDGRELTKGD